MDLTKLGTYLDHKRIWNSIDFQGQRSRSQGLIFRRGDTPHFALPLLDIKKLRNNSWKLYCVLSFNMGWQILVFKCSEINDLDNSFIISHVVFTKYQNTHFLITICMVPSSFLTYHGVCNKSNMAGATCWAGTAYSSWAPEFAFFFWPLCCLSLIS